MLLTLQGLRQMDQDFVAMTFSFVMHNFTSFQNCIANKQQTSKTVFLLNTEKIERKSQVGTGIRHTRSSTNNENLDYKFFQGITRPQTQCLGVVVNVIDYLYQFLL